jgi:hypothetical protein
MAFLLADTAFAGEGTGHLRIGAISFVVSNFTAVEALSGKLLRFRTITREMADLVATRRKKSA